MKKSRVLIFFILFIVFLASCEDVVDVSVNSNDIQISIDAVITNELRPQTIVISQSIVSFDNSGNFPPLSVDSVVIRASDGKRFFFEDKQDGNYIYTPNGSDTFAKNVQYVLNVYKENTVYTAQSTMMRSPQVDSITYDYYENLEGYLVNLHARDLPGAGDFYWIRTYRNGKFVNDPRKINISYDAGFEQAYSDTQEFLFPISFMQTNDFANPYKLGEKIKIEILGISEDFYQFLSMTQQQIQNGGMFAPPPVNVRTNFKKNHSTAINPVGFFNVCEINSLEIEIE